MDKIQINFTDGTLLHNKIPIDSKDSKGSDLYIGDTVLNSHGDVHVVGYRYGKVALVPTAGMHTVGTSEYTNYTKQEGSMTAIMGKFLLILMEDDPFYTQHQRLLEPVITNRIPQ